MNLSETYDTLIKTEDSMFMIVNNIAKTHDLTHEQVRESIVDRHKKCIGADKGNAKKQLQKMLTTPRLRNVNKQLAWWLLSEIET